MSGFSKKLRQLRDDKNLTIQECATAIGVSPSTYRDWEYGRSINGEPYIKIAELFGISLSELFGIGEQKIHEDVKELEYSLIEALEKLKRLKSSL